MNPEMCWFGLLFLRGLGVGIFGGRRTGEGVLFLFCVWLLFWLFGLLWRCFFGFVFVLCFFVVVLVFVGFFVCLVGFFVTFWL